MNEMNKLSASLIVCFSAGAVSAPPTGHFEERDITDVGWSVEYMGCVYDAASDTATYHYDMTVTDTEKDLSHWVLGIDSDMVPVASSGGATTSMGLDPTTGLYGFKWDDGQDKGTTASYSITFNGGCNEGPMDYSVKGGTYFAIGGTTGPSGEGGGGDTTTYSISGVVYFDANGNGSFDVDEPVIGNTTVALIDVSGNELTTQYSDTSGAYEFAGLVNGDYTVDVPMATDDSGDFNESIFEYFMANHGAVNVTIDGADVVDVNFGYQLSIADVMDDLDPEDPDADGYTFNGTGKTIGFWKHQHSVAMKGRGRAHIDEATLRGYLATIETLWLSDPFQFGSDAITDSFAVLSARTSDANELLMKQLLGCELNHVDGRGLSDNLTLQGLILAWAEYISHYNYLYSRETTLEVKDLIDTINNSGE